MSSTFRQFFRKEKGVLILIDPDRTPVGEAVARARKYSGVERVRGFLVGGSYLESGDFARYVETVKTGTDKKVVLFPGSAYQLAPAADGILFLTLLSGRNPQYLIGEQVRAAPIVRRMGLESIPTGYILIDGGSYTSVEFASNTRPIPRDKPQVLRAHAEAGELLGLQVLYLEAGSGALEPVPPDMIKTAKEAVSLPLLVGGGIRSTEQMEKAFTAGADLVVVGTAVEKGEMEIG